MTFPTTHDLTNQNTSIASAINRQWGQDVTAVQASRTAMMQYWRKCTRGNCTRHVDKHSGRNLESGWITVGPDMGAPLEHARYINNKHMTPLPQYGSMPYGETGAANAYIRFKQLIERGGLGEFPIDQIQAYNWDKIPEVANARPDCATTRIPCELGCVNREFLNENQYKDHVSGWHSEAKGTMAMGAEFAKVVRSMPSNQPNDPVQMGVSISAAIAQMLPSIIAAVREGNHPQEAVKATRGKAATLPVVEEFEVDEE